MKILSLRLHPFGGTSDRTYAFSENIQVLEGANEFGKSTFRAALTHALFTKTKLTAKKASELFGPWFPKPGGDFAQVTLHLESGGEKYKIEKRWGSRSSCSIKNESDNTEIANPDSVNRKIEDILCHNQATWENIFITQQDSITDTIETLKETPSVLQNAGIEVLENDINPKVLETNIIDELTKLEGNWDWDKNAPKRDNQNQSRGIENKWIKGVGDILEAWYEWQEAEKKLIDKSNYDIELDRINTNIQFNDGVIARLTPIIQENTKIRDTIFQRKTLELELKNKNTYFEELKKCNNDWPVFENQSNLNKIEIENKAKLLLQLDEELKNAITRSESDSLTETLKKIDEFQKDIAELAQKESKIKKIDGLIHEKLKNIEDELRELDLKIKAQSLTATLSSNLNFDFIVTTGTDEPRNIKLIAGSEQKFEASGKIVIQGSDLNIKVSSSQTDIDLLINDLLSKKNEKENLLLKLGLGSLRDANEAAETENKMKNEITRKREMLSNLMGNRKESDLAELRTRINNLPQTRSINDISALKTKAMEEKADLVSKQSSMQSSIDDWISKWKDKNGLLQEIIEVGKSIREITANLETLPTIPGNLESPDAFLEKFNSDSEDLKNANDNKLKFQREFINFFKPESGDIDELTELKNEKSASFQNVFQLGKSYKRILSVMQGIQPATDHYLKLHERIRENFKELTNGKYINLDHANGLPEKVGHDTITLETALLSQGTRTSLAIAVRLSLAELYLEKSSAFIVMDDPFVDLDFSRREAGINLLKKLGLKTQVIFLTCHSNHAAEVSNNRVKIVDA